VSTDLRSNPALTPVDDGPVGVFLSYASEDSDIAAAFYKALEQIRELTDGGVRTFFDRASIKIGEDFSQAIRNSLQASSYMLVFYTGTYKKSHSYTGLELGYFEALIDDERNSGEAPTRKIVPIYIDEIPSTAANVQGVSLKISPSDLRLTPDAYKQKITTRDGAQSTQDPLTKLLNEIARSAEQRRFQTLEQEEIERRKALRSQEISHGVVPAVKIAMFECLGRRVARRSIEQKLIEFEVESSILKARPPQIPANAQLTGHGEVFSLFGLTDRDDPISWEDFCTDVSVSAEGEAGTILRTINRVFESAVSTQTPLDNDQLIRGTNEKIYRVIVTRHFDYFSGKKILHMYFIERLRLEDYGDEKTSLILSFVNVTARYRFIFLEPESSLSEQAFVLEGDAGKLKRKVEALMRQLIMIEEESHILRLDSAKARVAIFGPNADLTQLKQMSTAWIEARKRLKEAADQILAADPDGFGLALEKWLAVLKEFTAVAREINAELGCRAIDALREVFSHH
jgi:hypothetical protein